jgi:hypothetical protein
MLFCDWRSVGQSVLVSGPHLGPMTRLLLLSDICSLYVEGCPPWREDGSVIYSYSLLSLCGTSPAELITTSYCLIRDSPNLEGQVPVFISPAGTRWPSYTQGHWVYWLPSYGRYFITLANTCRRRNRFPNLTIIKDSQIQIYVYLYAYLFIYAFIISTCVIHGLVLIQII